MATIFSPNIAICPKCNHYFEYNQVNGLALFEAARKIDARKRMYCRLVLDSVERLDRDGGMKFPVVKKIVLDNFNDLNRDILTVLGIGVDAE